MVGYRTGVLAVIVVDIVVVGMAMSILGADLAKVNKCRGKDFVWGFGRESVGDGGEEELFVHIFGFGGGGGAIAVGVIADCQVRVNG